MKGKSRMKISTETNSITKIVGYEKAIEYIAKAGFDAFDFSLFEMAEFDWENMCVVENNSPLRSDDYLEFVRKLKRVADDNGIICNQTHAPFPVYCPDVCKWLKRAIECTKELGAEVCVIHPDNSSSAYENAKMYKELLPFAKENNVKIATENMWNWDKEKGHASEAACSHHKDFLSHIEAVNDEYFVACLDIGHAEMQGLNTSAVEMIKTLKNHIQALHIHDNDMTHDSHQIPNSMDIDFAPIVKALKDIGYSGYFTLEADQFLKDYTEENVFEGVIKMSDSAKELAQMFDNL